MNYFSYNKTGIFYLNNTGSRWIELQDGKKPKIKVLTPQGFKFLTPIYYTSFGNFGTVAIRYKGIKYELFQDFHLLGGAYADLLSHLIKFRRPNTTNAPIY